MKFKNLAALAIVLIAAGYACAQPPRVFLLDAKALQATKAKVNGKSTADSALQSAVARAERDAQGPMKAEFKSVVAKTALPPSGDKHDYMSQAPYFWPNPDTKNGLPYVRRDGERNPEIKKFPDHDLLDQMVDGVERLAVAYYFTGKEEYAARAAGILRTWFLDSATKMNPNLEYAQAVPGVNTGRGIGLIETRGLPRVVDSIGLLAGSKAWTAADQKGVEAWFAAFLKWMRESKNGVDESNAKNNHGTYYDVQIASFALFVRQPELAKSILETAKTKRVASQIEADGRQPLELERTKSWNYSTMNLEGMLDLASLGDAAGVDIWRFQTADGRGIRRALEFLHPFATGEKKWTYQQIEEFRAEPYFESMRRAASKYDDEKFRKLMSAVPAAPAGSRFYLTGN